VKMRNPSEHHLAMVNIAQILSASVLFVARTFKILQNQHVVLGVQLGEVALGHGRLQTGAGVTLLVEDDHAPDDLRVNLKRQKMSKQLNMIFLLLSFG